MNVVRPTYPFWYVNQMMFCRTYEDHFQKLAYRDNFNVYNVYMWYDVGKSVLSRTCDIFSFLFDWSSHLERYILLKTPPESDQWFQSYKQLKESQNNRKQKKIFISFLAISHNQCFRLSTDSPRSQHICDYIHWLQRSLFQGYSTFISRIHACQ